MHVWAEGWCWRNTADLCYSAQLAEMEDLLGVESVGDTWEIAQELLDRISKEWMVLLNNPKSIADSILVTQRALLGSGDVNKRKYYGEDTMRFETFLHLTLGSSMITDLIISRDKDISESYRRISALLSLLILPWVRSELVTNRKDSTSLIQPCFRFLETAFSKH